MTITELINGIKNKTVLEAFGSGTACCVCPIGSLTHQGDVKFKY
jgi:hypothetical protein